MVVTTGNEIPDHQIVEILGIIRGIVVRAPGIGQGIMGGLKQIVGGNIESYARVWESSGEDAYERMVQHA